MAAAAAISSGIIWRGSDMRHSWRAVSQRKKAESVIKRFRASASVDVLGASPAHILARHKGETPKTAHGGRHHLDVSNGEITQWRRRITGARISNYRGRALSIKDPNWLFVGRRHVYQNNSDLYALCSAAWLKLTNEKTCIEARKMAIENGGGLGGRNEGNRILGVKYG